MVVPSRKLRAPDAVRATLRHLHPGLKRKVGAVLEAILLDPEHGKGLRGELIGLRSARVGRLRVVYRVTPAAIELVAIGPRTAIYEQTVRLLRRQPKKDAG
jgi:mRNA-degrading endonuclease RelE of RelBE toxin-antitoxin system